MKKVLFIFLCFILLSGVIFAGCATNVTTTPSASTTPVTSVTQPKTSTLTTAPAQTSATPAVAATMQVPQYGGGLKIITQPGLTSLGVPGVVGMPSDGLYNRPCVETLMGLDAEGKGLVVPNLATSWQVSSDYKSITFSLRKGVKFHDGTDFNADAAKYCLTMLKDSTLTTLKSVASIDVVDDYTIRLNLSSYDPAILTNLQRDGRIISPTALKTQGIDYCKTHPIGTGPFKFVSYTIDVSLKYERFDGYWGGKPYLDNLEWVFIADPVTSIVTFKAGQAQVIRAISAKDASDLKAAGIDIAMTPAYIQGLVTSGGDATSPFSEKRVRQAISCAIDTQAIAKTLGYGFFPATNQFSAPLGYAYNSAVVGYPYNPTKAKQLLADAGYSSGFKTTITFKVGAEDVFVPVQSYLNTVGIDAKLEAQERSLFLKTSTTGWKGLIQYQPSYSIGFDPGASLIAYLSSKATSFTPVTIGIPTGYDTKLFQANSEPDAQKRQVLFQELSKIIIDDYCLAIPIYVSTSLVAISPKVHDLDMNKYCPHDWHPEKAWLSK